LTQPRPASESPEDLEKLYSTRFAGKTDYRNRVWQILTREFFSRWVKPTDTILDLGCGYGEFINNVRGAKKFAMDLNPSTKNQLNADIEFLEQDCSQPWPLEANSLDVIFTSNFFEHLPSKHVLQATVLEAFRCLKPNGRLIALGPNVKYLAGEYWDFFDHYIPITEMSLSELLSLSGFRIEKSIARFLPYTMSLGHEPALWKLRVFLKYPIVWRFFGRQFLVIGQKPE
jgi:SAM-dependent methyltransferase